jgi:hypothetical protein
VLLGRNAAWQQRRQVSRGGRRHKASRLGANDWDII